jgi:hypothetical protein
VEEAHVEEARELGICEADLRDMNSIRYHLLSEDWEFHLFLSHI